MNTSYRTLPNSGPGSTNWQGSTIWRTNGKNSEFNLPGISSKANPTKIEEETEDDDELVFEQNTDDESDEEPLSDDY